MIKVGDSVVYIDPTGQESPALVTCVFDGGDQEKIPNPSLNLVFTSGDLGEVDQYGRQIKRNTSVVHKTNQYAHGNYWRRLDE